MKKVDFFSLRCLFVPWFKLQSKSFFSQQDKIQFAKKETF